MSAPIGSPENQTSAIKGLHFVGQTNAIKSMAANAQRFRDMVSALPADTQLLIERPPAAADWISMEHRLNLHNAAVKVCFAGDTLRFFEVGKLTAKHTTRLAYRAFIKFMSPEQVAKRASTLWQMITRNNGVLNYAEPSSKTIELSYVGLFLTNEAYWQFVRGNLTYFMECTGVKNTSVTLISGGRTEPHATFRLTWT